MTGIWNEFEGVIAHANDSSGRSLEFWWRDDDACRPDPALTRLLELAVESGVPLALAVVPELADPCAFSGLHAGVTVLQHGVDHGNRAIADDKKTEFPATETIGAALRRLIGARIKLELVAGAHALSVLAPPWNRISPALVPHLASAGYRGLSTFGTQKFHIAAAGLTQVNTHIDIIDWRGTRGFCGEERAFGQLVGHLAKVTSGADSPGPIGWLTHHAVHDPAAWEFLDRLFEVTRNAGVKWRCARNLFGSANTE